MTEDEFAQRLSNMPMEKLRIYNRTVRERCAQINSGSLSVEFLPTIMQEVMEGMSDE